MEIYLMQHGDNLPEKEDPLQRLSPKGRKTIQAAAAAINKMGLQFDLIICSPKERSKETAAIIAAGIGYPGNEIIETDKVKAMTPPEETIAFLQAYKDAGSVYIAGHLPSLARLAAHWLSPGEGAQIRFVRGGVGRIDVESVDRRDGELVWYLTPEQLRLIAGEVA